MTAHRSASLSHPLGPVTRDEITQSSALIRAQWPEGTLFVFKVITLLEPPKIELVPWLDAVKAGQSPKPLDRKTTVIYYLRNTVCGSPFSSRHVWVLTVLSRTNFTRLSST